MLYFYSLVNMKGDQAVYVFLMTQFRHRTNKDWVAMALKDFNDLNMSSDFETLQNTSLYTFKRDLKKNIRIYAFEQMMTEKNKKSKLQNVNYFDLKLQEYLVDPSTSTEDKLVTFQWRTRMHSSFGENFRGARLTTICMYMYICHMSQ